MASTNAPDGTVIDYETHGQATGTAVVLVHGITESRESWAPIVDRLARHHHVVALDLRGHGSSGTAERYDLEAMAGDVAAVVADVGVASPHLVGHSLGGAVVTAVGAVMPVTSITNVDQSLRLATFKEQLMPFEEQLRDPAAFPAVVEALFSMMAGDLIDDGEKARLTGIRRADQSVVLGVWEMILSSSVEEIDAVVDGALAGYRGSTVPYLALFGDEPGGDYEAWLRARIERAEVETWPLHGHYPHLVAPDRFVMRLEEFWTGATH